MPQLLRDHTPAFHSAGGNDFIHSAIASTNTFALARTHANPPFKQEHHAQTDRVDPLVAGRCES